MTKEKYYVDITLVDVHRKLDRIESLLLLLARKEFEESKEIPTELLEWLDEEVNYE